MMKMVKVNYILDAHNNGKKYFETVNAKKVLKLDQKCQRYGEIYQHIKIAKNLPPLFLFLKRQKFNFNIFNRNFFEN